MLSAKHSIPTKSTERNTCVKGALPPTAVSGKVNVVQSYNNVVSCCCPLGPLANGWTVSSRRTRVAAANSAEVATAVTTTETGLKELNKDTFHAFINNAGDAVVVVDFFTDWCGPCKLIYPELVKLSAELSPAAQIVKFNCNQANKELAKALGIKVAPTFHIYKNGTKVADMTGAKVDKLRSLIEEQLNQN